MNLGYLPSKKIRDPHFPHTVIRGALGPIIIWLNRVCKVMFYVMGKGLRSIDSLSVT